MVWQWVCVSLIPLQCCLLHIQSYPTPIWSAREVVVGKHTCVPHISPPLGQNKHQSIRYFYLESGDCILLGIVSRKRYTHHPVIRVGASSSNTFFPFINLLRGFLDMSSFFVHEGRPAPKYVCIFPHQSALWCRAWQVYMFADVVWGNLGLRAWLNSQKITTIHDFLHCLIPEVLLLSVCPCVFCN